MPDTRFAVYILASKTKRLYIGVTSDIERRLAQHRAGGGSGFAHRYSIDQLVFVEWAPDPLAAISREKMLKGWVRAKKIALIEGVNPEWRDLSKT